MRILFFSHYFPPEVNAPATRTFEHCRRWAQTGHEVHVITCVPNHPAGIPFEGYRSRWYSSEVVSGVTVHRVWTYLAANTGVVRRTVNYASFIVPAVWRALRLGRCDVIVATSPQFFCAVAGYLASSVKRTPWVFEVRDLWPDSVAAVGAVRPGVLLSLARWLELRMYRHAALVACLTRSFIENLEARGIPPGKLAFVPNGVDPDQWKATRPSAGRQDLGLRDADIIVSFVGTVGMAHGLATVLDAADLVREKRPDIRFVVVGDGSELKAIREAAESRSLGNITFTGLVPKSRAQDYLVASDICLVPLRRAPLFRTVLPSKMLEAMGAGKPIVLSVEGEAREVLERSGGGVAVEPESAAELASAVLRLAEDGRLRATMGAAGQKFVEKEFNRIAWADRYLSFLSSATSARAPLAG